MLVFLTVLICLLFPPAIPFVIAFAIAGWLGVAVVTAGIVGLVFIGAALN